MVFLMVFFWWCFFRAGIPGFAHGSAEKQNQKNLRANARKTKKHKKAQKHPKNTPQKNSRVIKNLFAHGSALP